MITKNRVGASRPGSHCSRDMKVAIESASPNVDGTECALCPLSRVKAGVEVRIKQLCATPEVATRLREIGFGEDQIVKLITGPANIICLVCNARLAISAQLAQLILVEPFAPALSMERKHWSR